MKLQRYNPTSKKRIIGIMGLAEIGEWCKYKDVEKLEQLNAEMLEELKKCYERECNDCNHPDPNFCRATVGCTIKNNLKSIIEKAESTK